MSLFNRFFTSKLINQVGLFLPVLFLFTSLVAIFSGHNSLRYDEASWQLLLATFFNNGMHLLITAYLLFFVDEFNQFLGEKSAELKKSVLLFFAKVFIAYTAVFLLIESIGGATQQAYATYLVLASQVAIVIFAIHHEASQSFGLTSLQYHSRMQNAAFTENTAAIQRLIGYERLFVPIILFVSLIYTYAKHSLEMFHANLVLVSCVFLIACYEAFVLIKIYRVEKDFFKTRGFFMARYLLLPLSFLSAIAALGRVVTHRYEYYQIAHLTHKHTRGYQFKKINLILFSMVALILSVMFARRYYTLYVSYSLNQELELNAFDKFINVLTISLGFTHYYIDRVIFKFKDMAVLKNQGHIFKRAAADT